jgi:hypothetical protein
VKRQTLLFQAGKELREQLTPSIPREPPEKPSFLIHLCVPLSPLW